MEICTGVHAEMNALVFAGPASRTGTLYCTIVPCNTCAKMIVNAGIKRVVYSEGYPDVLGVQTMRHSGVSIERLPLSKARREAKRETEPGQHEGAKAQLDAATIRDVERIKRGLREEFAKETTPYAENLNTRAAKLLGEKIKKTPKRAK